MNHLFKKLKTRTGNINLWCFVKHISAGILCLLVLFPGYTKAMDSYYYKNDTLGISRVSVYTSFYTKHLSPKPDHVEDQGMFGVEFRMNNKWMYGLAMFDNSFGQDTEYLYSGYQWAILKPDLSRVSHHYIKLTGGLIHGYEDKYEDKIPYNGLGVAPAIIPVYGYQYKKTSAEVILGGISVITIIVGYSF